MLARLSGRGAGYPGVRMAPGFVVAGLVALAAAGCGGGGSKPAEKSKASDSLLERIDTRPAKVRGAYDEIAELLAQRARALERGDIAAYADTAIGRQPGRDRRAARRAARLALVRVRLVPGETIQTGAEHARLAVQMSYSLRGMRRPFRTRRRLELRRTPDGWRVTRDAARPYISSKLRAFEERRKNGVSGYFIDEATLRKEDGRPLGSVLLTPRGVDPGQLLPGLTRAYRAIRRDLPRRALPPSVLVIAARDGAQTKRLVGPVGPQTVALANVAVKWGFAPNFEVERVLAQRMIVVVSRWSRMPPAERQKVLAHEMTHTALDPDTSGRTPAWLVEGVAMYVAGDDRSADARAGGLSVDLRDISGPRAIGRLRGREQDDAYTISSAAAHLIAARRGSKALFALLDAFNDKAIGGLPGARTTDRVLRATLGMSLTGLDRAVAGG